MQNRGLGTLTVGKASAEEHRRHLPHAARPCNNSYDEGVGDESVTTRCQATWKEKLATS